MEPVGKDFTELLNKAEQSIRTADHMVYITYPLIKENRLLKKVLEGLFDSSMCIVQAILSYEYLYKRVELYQDARLNWENFKQKSAIRFGITTAEIEIIKELFSIGEKHKDSSMEFVRKERIVIMSDNLRTESIGVDQLKRYLNTLKLILQKTRAKMASESPAVRRV